MIIRISVVLPAPLGPMRPSIGSLAQDEVVDVDDDAAGEGLDGTADADPRAGHRRSATATSVAMELPHQLVAPHVAEQPRAAGTAGRR